MTELGRNDRLVTPEELLAQCQEARDLALGQGADEAEVIAAWGTSQSVEFEKNDLQIAISDDETVYGVRIIKDQRLGFASTNDFESFPATLEDAFSLAKSSVADPLLGLAEGKEITRIDGLFHSDAAAVGVADVTSLGGELIRKVKDLDPRVSIDSGSVAAGQGARAIASSNGVNVHSQGSQVSCYLFGMAVDGDEVGSFAVAGNGSRSFKGFEEKINLCAEQFVQKTLGALRPGKGKSYLGDVLFTPEATSSLIIGNLLGMLNPSAIRKGKSPLGGKLSDMIASDLLTLVDDPTVPGELDSSEIDREGQPRGAQKIIENGRLLSIPYNQYEAMAAGQPGSTGHASGGAENLPGVSFGRVQMAAGSAKLQDLLGTSKPTIIVTRFSGSTNAITGEFSGVVKAGFVVENGERRPITEVLIAGNLLDLIRNINAISAETEKVFGRVPFPWVRAGGVSVTAG